MRLLLYCCLMCFQLLTTGVQCARLTWPTSERGAMTLSGCNLKHANAGIQFMEQNSIKYEKEST